MATVDETLRALIEAFPCSYPDRTQALHQVLVVVGAGYEWRGGEVVERHPDPRNCLSVHGQFKLSEHHGRLLRESGVDVPQEDLDGTCPAEHLRPRAAELARTPAALRGEVYQAGAGSLLLTVPKNVTADWARATREIAAVVGPLWATPSAYWNAVASSLTPNQQAYVRAKALCLLESVSAARSSRGSSADASLGLPLLGRTVRGLRRAGWPAAPGQLPGDGVPADRSAPGLLPGPARSQRRRDLGRAAAGRGRRGVLRLVRFARPGQGMGSRPPAGRGRRIRAGVHARPEPVYARARWDRASQQWSKPQP